MSRAADRDGARPGRPARPPGPAPGAAALREAALAHLARFEATEAGLARVLERAVARWARRAGAAEGADADAIAAAAAASRALVGPLVRDLAARGSVDDARFATRRAGHDARRGRSARASQAQLLAKGVAPDLAAAAASRDDDAELEAAVALARRRRIGPFAAEAPDDETARTARHRALGLLARAGFAGDVARRALALDRDEADAVLDRQRSRDG